MAGLSSLYGTEVTTLWEERPEKTVATLMLTWVGYKRSGKSQRVFYGLRKEAMSRALDWDPHRELLRLHKQMSYLKENLQT